MNGWPDASSNRRDGVTIPTIWVAVALSVLVHIAALWELWPHLNLLPLTKSEVGRRQQPVDRASHAPARACASAGSLAGATSRPSPDSEARPPLRRRHRGSPPPVMALNRPRPRSPRRRRSCRHAHRPPAPGRRYGAVHRGEAARPRRTGFRQRTERAGGRRRCGAANASSPPTLPRRARQTFGYDPAQGGGMFQIDAHGL